MHTVRFLVIAALAVAVSVVGATGASAASAHAVSGTAATRVLSVPPASHPSGSTPAVPRAGLRNPIQSSNWSGYAAVGNTNSYTSVSSSWAVPTVTCNNRGAIAQWVGLDGAQGPSNPTVEQTGSAVDCESGSPRYYAWYEMYPANSVQYGNSVQPGDNMIATVTVTSPGEYDLYLDDITQHWVQNNTVAATVATQNSSAEIILEAPSASSGQLPLPNFGFANFTGSSINGGSLAAAGAQSYYISQSGATDTTSGLDAASYFTVDYGNGANINGSPEIGYQAAGNQLWTTTPSASGFMGQSIRSGTSPSIAALPGGGFEEAFQSAGGLLIVYGTSFTFNTQLGMAANTSPSIAAAPGGGFEVAFQANSGLLYDFTAQSGGVSQGYQMAAGTSPSITALAGGGYETAFQASTGLLWEVGAYINFNTQLGMKSGTSPSIAAGSDTASDFQVAFQANTGYLYLQNLTTGGVYQPYAMLAGTSPSIAALAGGGFETAFQASTGLLWEIGAYINFNTQLGMKSGTSPSITALSGVVFEVAFQANTGGLWTQNLAVGGKSVGPAMTAGTNPAIAA